MTPDANALDVGRARDALDRFINLAFDKGGDRPRFSIPANPDRDDDLILSAALSRLAALEAENARLRAVAEKAKAQKPCPHCHHRCDAPNGDCPSLVPLQEALAALEERKEG